METKRVRKERSGRETERVRDKVKTEGERQKEERDRKTKRGVVSYSLCLWS